MATVTTVDTRTIPDTTFVSGIVFSIANRVDGCYLV